MKYLGFVLIGFFSPGVLASSQLSKIDHVLGKSRASFAGRINNPDCDQGYRTDSPRPATGFAIPPWAVFD